MLCTSCGQSADCLDDDGFCMECLERGPGYYDMNDDDLLDCIGELVDAARGVIADLEARDGQIQDRLRPLDKPDRERLRRLINAVAQIVAH